VQTCAVLYQHLCKNQAAAQTYKLNPALPQIFFTKAFAKVAPALLAHSIIWIAASCLQTLPASDKHSSQ
jgi:hypothetical protein